MHPGSRAGRIARTGCFASVSLALALISHRVAGGNHASDATVGGALALLLLVGWPLSRRLRSGRVVTAVVVGTQLALHLAFDSSAVLAHRNGGRTTDWAALLFCHHGSHPITAAQIAAAKAPLDLGATASTHSAALPALVMLAAHLVAAVAVAWWIRCGERAVWAAASRVVRRAMLIVARLQPTGRRALIASARRRVLCARDQVTTIASRAPPLRADLACH